MDKKQRSKTNTDFSKQQILRVSPQKSSSLIKNQLKKGTEILEEINESTFVDIAEPIFDLIAWNKFNIELLRTIFTTELYSKEYENSRIESIESITYNNLRNYQNKLTAWHTVAEKALISINERLVLFEYKPKLRLEVKEDIKPTGTSIFIVHGRNETAKQTVARFLENLDLTVVILHEKPDLGKTIIEKLESTTSQVDIGYAVVLLTPDDLGKINSEEATLSARARQNVIFELGYFIAILGRKRVCPLYSKGVELPSDYQGVLYKEYDEAGAWRFQLARELIANEFSIDLNKLA